MRRYLEWPAVMTTLLVLGCVICLLAIAFQTNWGREWRRDATLPAMRPAKAAVAPMLPEFRLAALDAGFPESASRPLFMPNRRPVPSAASAPTMKRGQFLLVGTSRTKEFGDSAMLKDVASNKTTVVKLGATIRDMTLESVGPDRAVLKLGDETEELVMKAQPKAATPSASTVPRPPGTPAAASTPAVPNTAAASPGAGIFGGQPATSGQQPSQPLPPGTQFAPGAPGSPTVFPGAPGSSITPANAASGAAPTPRAPTAEEILERRRRARAQQAP